MQGSTTRVKGRGTIFMQPLALQAPDDSELMIPGPF